MLDDKVTLHINVRVEAQESNTCHMFLISSENSVKIVT